MHDDPEQRKPAAPAPERREPEIKVTDRRMFTPEGDLREEYRHLADAPPPSAPTLSPPPAEEAPPPPDAASAGAPPSAAQPGRSAPPPPGSPGGPSASTAGAAAPGPAAGRPPEVELPREPGGGPGLLDLVGLLVESAAVYLGDARLPDGGSAEDLPMARFHVDLLDVLRQKTAGNLTAQESEALEDVLYRLRMRYVQKRG